MRSKTTQNFSIVVFIINVLGSLKIGNYQITKNIEKEKIVFGVDILDNSYLLSLFLIQTTKRKLN